jgi:tetratricopeptide (TPR) repeat protein
MNTQTSDTTQISVFHKFLQRVQKYTHRLPHYTRFFSASGVHQHIYILKNMFVWAILIGIILANIFMAYGKQIVMSSFGKHIPPRIQTAVFPSSNVLGISDKERTNSVKMDTLKQEYEYWKSIIRNHPDYRDAYIQASIYAYQLGSINEARAYITKAKSLDPNYHDTVIIESILDK